MINREKKGVNEDNIQIYKNDEDIVKSLLEYSKRHLN